MAQHSIQARVLLWAAVALVSILFHCAPTGAAPADKRTLGEGFAGTIRPFLEANCVECHAGNAPEADLDLTRFATLDTVVQDHRRWETVLARLEAREMPPEEAQRQPADDERQAVIDWIRRLRTELSQRNAGDPGVVLARRLSSAEYNYTIRDLTGIDIQPTRAFPVDPTNEAGFDN
jgi:hypothetical protein